MDSVLSGPSGRTVFLLGAGFSRAVASVMPLTKDLSCDAGVRQVFDHADFKALLPEVGELTFEQILDHVAIHAPWRSDSERFRASALYTDLSTRVAQVIGEFEAQARVHPMPSDLQRLVEVWDGLRSPVISLNYDLIVEAAYAQLMADRGEESTLSAQDLYPVEIPTVNSLRGATFGRLRQESFVLCKLHGSRNFVSQYSSFGWAEATYLGTSPGCWEADSGSAPDENPSFRPVIVPPTTLKTDLYKNAVIDRMWVKAGEILKGADQVVVIGYSLPAGDLAVISLLREAVPAGTPIRAINIEDVTLSYEERLGRTVSWDGDLPSYVTSITA